MRPRLKPIHRQTIVITGATSGNGLAAARLAAGRGAAVVLAARNLEALEAVRDELQRSGARAAVCAADVAVESDVERIAETAISAFGGLTAGSTTPRPPPTVRWSRFQWRTTAGSSTSIITAC